MLVTSKGGYRREFILHKPLYQDSKGPGDIVGGSLHKPLHQHGCVVW